MTVALAAAMIVGAGGSTFHSTDSWNRRFRLAALGLLVGALAFWVDGWKLPHLSHGETNPDGTTLFGFLTFAPETLSVGIRYLLYFGLALGVGRWWRATARDRKERFSLFPPIAAAFWGAVLLFLWPWEAGSPLPGGIVPLVLATVAVQTASAWSPPPAALPKRLRYRPA